MLFIGNLNVIKNNKTSILKQIVKFVQLSWPRKKTNRKKEKGHLFNITWRRYTTDHIACLWNQNDYPKIMWSKVSDVFSARLSLVVNHN